MPIITVSTLDQLNGAIAFVDAQTSGSYTIKLTADITEGTSALVASSGNLQNPDGTAAMSNGQPVAARNDVYALNLAVGVDLTIDGGNHTLDGASTYRGLFVYAGHVSIEDLTIAHAVAKGGAGGDGFGGGGGGGAGLGGGLFIGSNVAGNAGAVTLSNVNFQSNAAVGGASGITDTSGNHSFTGGGGGGGMGGSGAAGDAGANGGGISESAGTTTGFVLGATLGGDPGLDGGGNGNISGNGDNGGFGGGGGGAGQGGGAGGFGGAGGGGGSSGGGGGFGGGGGSNLYDFAATGHGGFGAGDGGTAGGGAGLAAGGDIFIQHGATLTIAEGTFDDASVSAESTSARRTGSAYGSGLFIMGDATITLGTGQTAGQTLAINDDITDQNGSYASNHGGALPTGTSADGSPNTGVGSLILAGAGTIHFGGVNTYTGTTTVQSGTFQLEGSVANSAVTI